MPIGPVDMLRRLGSGIHPGAGRSQAGVFAGMALNARKQATRGRTVRLEPNLAVDIELSDERLEQISRAADAAEASGARTLVTIDDRGAYLINLATRTIERGRQSSRAVDAPSESGDTDEAVEQDAGFDIAGVMVGVDAVAVLPLDAEAPVEKIFASPNGLIDSSGTENANHFLSTGVHNASLAHLLAAHVSGSVGE